MLNFCFNCARQLGSLHSLPTRPPGIYETCDETLCQNIARAAFIEQLEGEMTRLQSLKVSAEHIGDARAYVIHSIDHCAARSAWCALKYGDAEAESRLPGMPSHDRDVWPAEKRGDAA